MNTVDQIEVKLSEIIDLKLIDECRNIEEWITEVQKCLIESGDVEKEISRAEIESFLNGKMREGEMIWSDSTGCIMAV